MATNKPRPMEIHMDQERSSHKYRMGYKAGYAASERKRIDDDKMPLSISSVDKLVDILSKVLTDLDPNHTHVGWIDLEYWLDLLTPTQSKRQPRISKGSLARWTDEQGQITGGKLIKQIDMVQGIGEIWRIETPQGNVDRLLTSTDITRFGRK